MVKPRALISIMLIFSMVTGVSAKEINSKNPITTSTKNAAALNDIYNELFFYTNELLDLNEIKICKDHIYDEDRHQFLNDMSYSELIKKADLLNEKRIFSEEFEEIENIRSKVILSMRDYFKIYKNKPLESNSMDRIIAESEHGDALYDYGQELIKLSTKYNIPLDILSMNTNSLIERAYLANPKAFSKFDKIELSNLLGLVQEFRQSLKNNYLKGIDFYVTNELYRIKTVDSYIDKYISFNEDYEIYINDVENGVYKKSHGNIPYKYKEYLAEEKYHSNFSLNHLDKLYRNLLSSFLQLSEHVDYSENLTENQYYLACKETLSINMSLLEDELIYLSDIHYRSNKNGKEITIFPDDKKIVKTVPKRYFDKKEKYLELSKNTELMKSELRTFIKEYMEMNDLITAISLAEGNEEALHLLNLEYEKYFFSIIDFKCSERNKFMYNRYKEYNNCLQKIIDCEAREEYDSAFYKESYKSYIFYKIGLEKALVKESNLYGLKYNFDSNKSRVLNFVKANKDVFDSSYLEKLNTELSKNKEYYRYNLT